MITVKFFGLLNVNNSIRQCTVQGDKFEDVIEQIISMYPSITKKQLLSSVIFINKNQLVKKNLKLALKDGDEVAFISPTSGG